jgi:hypothetical protein
MALNNTRKHLSITPKFDLIQLSSYLQTLSSSLYNYLKQRLFQQQPNHRQLSIQLELTVNETCALEVSQTKPIFSYFHWMTIFRFYKVIHPHHHYKPQQV